MGEILAVAEVAAYLKISQPTVRRWCARKKLPAFKIGREWRIDKEELDRVIHTYAVDNARWDSADDFAATVGHFNNIGR